MRALGALLVGLVLCGAPARAQGASLAGVRLLVLDVEGAGVPEEDVEVLQGLVSDGLRGREGILLITPDDVRARAPMEADRLAGCREELCLFELAEAVDAAFVLFADATREGDALALEVGLFARATSAIVARESVEGETPAALAGFVAPALDRVLAPLAEAPRPSLLERPLFLGGAALFATGAVFALGAGGWALEMDAALGDPDVHRDEKQRALELGPTALWLTAGAGVAAALGAGVMGVAAALE